MVYRKLKHTLVQLERLKTLDPNNIEINQSDWQDILGHVAKYPALLFFDPNVRRIVAQSRAKTFQRSEYWSGGRSRIIEKAIDYNTMQMNRFLESHVVRLIRPLSILDPIYDRANQLAVLSIGPRNENELFHLCAYGFDLAKIQAIDLVSNSPLVAAMDMHDLKFDDDRFDVVISGWTLPYSTDPKRALSEKMRVLRPGGLLCIGLTRIPPDFEEASVLESQGATNYLSSQQILNDFDRGIERIEFQNDPFDQTSKGAILLIVRKPR